MSHHKSFRLSRHNSSGLSKPREQYQSFKLSNHDYNQIMVEMDFHSWFSGGVQLIVLIALGISKWELSYNPNNEMLKTVYMYSYNIIIYPLIFATAGAVLFYIDSVLDGTFFQIIFLPVRIAFKILVMLIRKPTAFTPKNIIKQIFRQRDLSDDAFISAIGMLILLPVVSISGIVENIYSNPITSNLYGWGRFILVIWICASALSGKLLLAFSSSALLIINWLTPILGFAPEETEAERIKDEFLAIDPKQENKKGGTP